MFLRAERRRAALRLFLPRGNGVHVQDQQAPGHHPLSRLADGAGAGAALRNVSALGHATSPRVLHRPQLQASGRDRRSCPAGHRPEYFAHYDRLRDNHNPHAINLMKGGIVYSNFVTTVSPRHAWEAKDGGQGFGLEPTLNTHHYKFGGVLNGLDYDQFNPQTDP